MRLTAEQVASLSDLDWFPDGKIAAWGDDELLVFGGLLEDARERAAEEWIRYVHFLSLSDPDLVPSENFCRRVALVLANHSAPEAATEAVADSLTNDALALLFQNGWLARIDSLSLDDHTAYKVIKGLIDDHKNRSSGHFGRLAAFFQLREINPLHLEFFTTEAAYKSGLSTEAMALLASHPRMTKRALKTIAGHASAGLITYSRDKTEMAQRGYKSWEVQKIMGTIYVLRRLDDRKALKRSVAKKFKAFAGDVSPSLVDFYANPSDLASLAEGYTSESWWKHFFEARDGQYGTYDMHLPGDSIAILYGVGSGDTQVPPGVALYATSQLLVRTERGAKVDPSDLVLWAVPYMRAAKAWLVEALAADNVPIEWLVSLLGYEDHPTLDNWELTADAHRPTLVDS